MDELRNDCGDCKHYFKDVDERLGYVEFCTVHPEWVEISSLYGHWCSLFEQKVTEEEE